MFNLLLIVIYLAFISLGLPDSLLGTAWPVMHLDLNTKLSLAGIITMLISCGTIISSLFSDKLIKKFGSGLVVSVSTLLTAICMLCFSFATNLFHLILLSIPYGLGAGAIDACLNNYVALHYSSKHMSWLHCFWGLGATISPKIMGYCLTNLSWSYGYKIVSIIQLVLTFLLFMSLPLWKKSTSNEDENSTQSLSLFQTLKLKGVILILITFFCYCALEQTTMLWASSYLVKTKNFNPDKAAEFASLFFLGMTVGRFLSGCITEKLGDKKLIRLGYILILIGLLFMIIPIKLDILMSISLLLIGLGCAPIYPSIIHQTPIIFGKDKSQSIIGIQMACAYLGTTFMPPLFGLICEVLNIKLLPYYILILTIIMICFNEKLNKFSKNNS